MENDNEIIKMYIEAKNKYISEGFNICYLFEMTYLKELNELYGKKMLGMEKRLDDCEGNLPQNIGKFLMCAYLKKNFDENLDCVKVIHIASVEGFSTEEFAYIEIESTEQKPLQKSLHFLEVFTKIINNRKMVPDKTLIMLSQQRHHTMLSENSKFQLSPRTYSSKIKKREKAASLKGQKMMTQYFQSTKSPLVSSINNIKPKESFKYKVEEIAQHFREDNVKILWYPKMRLELQPSEILSVFLLNELGLWLEANPELDMKTGCEEVIDRFPSKFWEFAVDQVKNWEEHYRNPKDCGATTEAVVENEKDNNN